MPSKKFIKIFSNEVVFYKEYNAYLKSLPKKDVNLVHPNGYNSDLGIYANNLHILQQRYISELGDNDCIKKEVEFVDAAKFMFPTKKVHYRLWKAHLKKVGTSITHCNHHIAPFDLKNILFKLFQRNVNVYRLPINYLRLGLELDEVVEHCMCNGIYENQKEVMIKVLFNPTKELTGKQRRSAAAKIIRA
tara:strand:- start:7253 stop:7822 length:570 start_codon:yes stop_codon:yes gene_type:complete